MVTYCGNAPQRGDFAGAVQRTARLADPDESALRAPPDDCAALEYRFHMLQPDRAVRCTDVVHGSSRRKNFPVMANQIRPHQCDLDFPI